MNVAVDVPGVGIGHEQRVRANGRTASAEDRHVIVGEVERLSFGILKETHASLVQGSRQSVQQFTRAKAAAEEIDNPAGISPK